MLLSQKSQQEMNRRLNRRSNFPTGDKAENRSSEQEILIFSPKELKPSKLDLKVLLL